MYRKVVARTLRPFSIICISMLRSSPVDLLVNTDSHSIVLRYIIPMHMFLMHVYIL